MKVYGIDASHHQGTINWERTASELRRVNGGNNPGFAILRAGYSARHGKGGLCNDGQIPFLCGKCICQDCTAAAAFNHDGISILDKTGCRLRDFLFCWGF